MTPDAATTLLAADELMKQPRHNGRFASIAVGNFPRSEEWFMRRVMPEPNSGCWLWTGTVLDTGYGHFSTIINGKRKNHLAHRISYEMFVRPIPAKLHIDHLCRVRSCVNPAHLEAVTVRVNILRGVGRTAENARKMHCPKGHPLIHRESETTMRRRCVTCNAANTRKWRKKILAEKEHHHVG